MVKGMPDYYQRVGQNIAYYRTKQHLNQDGLALRAGISRGYLSQIEAARAKTNPTMDILLRICDALELPPALLFQEPPPREKRVRIR